MPYAERVASSSSRRTRHTSLPMPVAAFHNGEERRIPSLQSFVRRQCLEYFAAPDDDGRVGMRCVHCAHLPEEERARHAVVFPGSTASILAGIITLVHSHLPRCSAVPPSVVEQIDALREKDLAAAEAHPPGGRKRYRYAAVAEEMGFRDTDAGVRFIPPEPTVGSARKRQAAAAAGEARSAASSVASSQEGADWTDEDDLRLWEGQGRIGNKWKEVSEQVFQNSFRGDQLRNRWYSQAFKDLVARRFGKDAYREAQQAGKQLHSGGGPGGSQPSVIWTADDDARLWEAQSELGNRWKDITARLGRTNSDHVKTRWYSDKFKDYIAAAHGPEAYRAAHVAGKQERQGARPQVEWTDDDDRLLWTSCQDNVTGRNWEEISRKNFLGRMSDNHLKNRWYSAAFKKFVAREFGPDAYQNAKIGRRGAQSQVDWTAEDDALLWASHGEMGNRWAVISESKFGGRISENQVKNRWYSAPFKKYVAAAHGPEAHRSAKHRK